MPLKTQQDDVPQLNLTSMIDVVFLLIIFFMVAAKFSDEERAVDLRLPEVGGPATLSATPKTRSVAVYADGRVTLDNQPITLAELPQRLAAERQVQPQLSVVIRGDAACPFQLIASAMAACKEAGVGELGVSVRLAQTVAGSKR